MMIKDFEISVSKTEVMIKKYCGNSKIVKIPAYIDGKPVRIIGLRCFHKSSVEQIILPNTVQNVAPLAFAECQKLNYISIPNSVTHIHNDSFVFSKYFENPSNWEDGALYLRNFLIDARNAPEDCTIKPQNYKIKDGTRVIADEAFAYCENITHITMPNSIEYIGMGAFSFCSKLKSVVISNNVKIIAFETFCGCYSLTNVTIPESVTKIEMDAFKACDSLTDVYILNKNCHISRKSIPQSTTIHGLVDSTAEAYAKKYNNKFEEVKL